MTFNEIEREIQQIREAAGDSEVAHGLEDKLRERFIRHVASLDKKSDLASKAKLILTTQEIDFDRWCA